MRIRFVNETDADVVLALDTDDGLTTFVWIDRRDLFNLIAAADYPEEILSL